MTCPDVGTLRAWLDDEVGPARAEIAAHVDTCASCRSETDRLRADAARVAFAVKSLAPAAAPAPAALSLARQRIRLAAETPTVVRPRFGLGRWRYAAAGLAAALVLAVGLGTSEGRIATAAFLAQFRSQTIQPIAIDPTTAGRSPLTQLQMLGQVSGERPGQPQTVASLAEASARVGFAVKQPDAAALPNGLDRTPVVRVIPARDVRFTFDEATARKYFAEIGRADVTIPSKFNGATLVVSIPAAAVLEYRVPGATKNDPRARVLLVGQSREITAGTEGGVSLDEMRGFLLGLPGLPPDMTRQLRDIRNWQTTLPLPIPANQMSSQQTTVAGGPGVVLSERNGLGNGAVWQRNGQIYGVAGSYPVADIQRVADALR